MKKTGITIGAAALLLLAMAAALVRLNLSPAGEDPVTPDEDTLFVISPRDETDIRSIRVDNEAGGFAVAGESATTTTGNAFRFVLENAEAYPVSEERLHSAVYAVCNFAVSTLVAEEPGNPADFGLSPAAAQVTVTYDDGTTAQILLGDTALGGGRYASGAGGAVYLVGDALAAPFMKDWLYFMDTLLTPGNSTDSIFTSITLGGAVREEPVEIRRNQEDESSPVALSTYQILSPINLRLDATNGTGSLLGLFGLSAEEAVHTVAGEEDLAAYGLAEPYSTAQVASAEGSFSLWVSQPDAAGMAYLYKEGTELVYRLNQGALPWLELQYTDLMDPVAVLPYINRLETVAVETAEAAYTFHLTGEDEELAVSLDGAAIDAAAFRPLYVQLISASLDEETAETPGENAALRARITYVYRGGAGQDVVELLEGPARRVFIRLNDGPWFLTRSLYADSLLEQLAGLL